MPPDVRFMGVPLSRLIYRRLGPEPDFTASILSAEGRSGQVVAVLIRSSSPANAASVVFTGLPAEQGTRACRPHRDASTK
jgi:hypothetical protein